MPADLSSKTQKKVLQLQLEINNLKEETTENKPASSKINEQIKNRELAIEQLVQEDSGRKAEILQDKINKSKVAKTIVEETEVEEVISVTPDNKADLVEKYKLSDEQAKDLFYETYD